MNFLANGKVQFDDQYEMCYNLFNAIGIGVANGTNYLYDQDTGITLNYKGKAIKAAIVPQPIYAGKTDVVFNPVMNHNIMTTLFGYYIDKEADSTNQIGFLSQYVEDNEARDKQRLVVRTVNGDVYSNFYTDLYLAFVECIFTLSGDYNVDLTNLDTNCWGGDERNGLK